MIDGSNHPAFSWTPEDESAEREAQALQFLADELGISAPTLFERRRLVPETRNCRYSLAASLKAHRMLQEHYQKRLQGLPSSYRFDAEICTKSDRKRREERRARRKELLVALEQLESEWVLFTEGCRLADLRPRTLHRRIVEGVVARTIIDKRVCVSVEGLQAYLRTKISK